MKDKFICIFPNKQTCTTVKILCCSSLISLTVLGTACVAFANTKEITPEREISVVRSDPYSPDWKILWDGARNLVREGHLILASKAYAQLFAIKPNIEEANWEYCKILLSINSFETASKIASLLLEKNPNRIEYLLVAGEAAAQQKKYLEAERFFGLIFEKDPLGKYSDRALAGLAYSLRERGLKSVAFPLMQQLGMRRPKNSDLLTDLASDAATLGKFDLARQLYRTLLLDDDVSDTIMLQAVVVFDEAGFESERNSLYRRYLKKHPNYLPFRLKLIEVNELEENYDAVLTHLSYITQSSDNTDDLLLKAADIAQNKLNRSDKALAFLEQYRLTHPADSEVSALIQEIQEAMAKDLLSIVENGGAELLWDDLASISSNRKVIFQRMAVLLENDRKKQPLIDVLEIQQKNNFNSPEISLKLAYLLHGQKQYQKSLKYIQLTKPEDQNHDFLQMKADVELHLGLEVEALTSMIRSLALKPNDPKTRLMAVKLAGRLGRVEDQLQLFTDGTSQDYTKIPKDLLKTHIQMLGLNKIYGKALDICQRAIDANFGNGASIEFYLLQTELLRQSGSKRHAEQVLRQLLYERKFEDIVLSQLIKDCLEDLKTETARKWFQQFEKVKAPLVSPEKVLKFRLSELLSEIRLLRQEGEGAEALKLVDEAITLSGDDTLRGDKISFVTDFVKEKYLLYLAVGDKRSADELFFNSGYGFDLSPDSFALVQLYNSSLENVGGSNGKGQYNKYTDLPASKLFDITEEQIERQNINDAEKTIILAKKDVTDSVRVTNIEIDLAMARGDLQRAQGLTEGLEARFPGEDGFCRQKIDLLVKAAHYDKALDAFKRCFPGNEVVQVRAVDSGPVDIEVETLYARLLWNNKKYEDSLAVYSRLLDPPVHQKLIEEFNEKNIDYQYLTRHQTFWSSMMLLLDSDPEIIADLMAPSFLVDNMGNITGEIVSSNYELYSWQNLIEDEFAARKANFNKNYHFAAKSYEKLLQREESTENKVDLATIYGRIGEFRKEAQVYEEIASEGEVTPELQESMKRNILQIRPTNTLDATLEERDGREGVVDIRKSSIGTTFWFTPNLDMDFWFKYAHNNYESTSRNQDTAADVIQGAMNYEFGDNYEINGGIGAEKFNGSKDAETQYNIELKGQLDDYVSGYIHYEKDPVEDTVASLEDNIYRQFIQTGMNIETALGVSFGGDLQYSLYSDDNERNRFYLFSSYSIFGESLQFDIRYSYQYLASKDINGPDGISSENVNQDFVTSYWSPETYSEHRIGFQYKKDFFGYLTDVENKMSYFLFDTGISLEDEETVAYSTRFDIFLEMSPHLLLKGNFSFHSSDVYKDKILSLSLHYSW